MYFTLGSIPELRELSRSDRLSAWRKAEKVAMNGWFTVVEVALAICYSIALTATGHLIPLHPILGPLCLAFFTMIPGMLWLQVKINRVLPVIRRQIGNLCLNCGYNVSQSVQRCPECGKSIPPLPDAP